MAPLLPSLLLLRRFSSSRSSAVTNVIRFQQPDGKVSWGQRISDTTAKVIEGCLFDTWKVTDNVSQINKLLSPIKPTQIMCIGLNYRRHAEETNMPIPKYPVLFFKNVASAQNPFDPIIIPTVASTHPEVDYEAELAVVIGKDCRDASVEGAMEYVLGYTVSNDVSARRWQGAKGGKQWGRAKSFDTFCPLGPTLLLRDAVGTAANGGPVSLRLSTTLNGELLQDSTTDDMIFGVPELVSYLSQDTTLPAGTVILTGTPEGVGFTRDPPVFLSPGDEVVVEVEGIGALVNPVVAAVGSGDKTPVVS